MQNQNFELLEKAPVSKAVVTIQNPEQKLTMVHQEQRDG